MVSYYVYQKTLIKERVNNIDQCNLQQSATSFHQPIIKRMASSFFSVGAPPLRILGPKGIFHDISL